MTLMTPASRRLLIAALTGYGLSVATLLGWSVTGQSNYSVAFQCALLIPLLFPFVGLIKAKPYTHAWSGFIAAIYLLSSATSWWVYPQERILASVSIISLLLWVLASTYFARLRGRELGLGLKKLKSQTE